jgi:PAS domain S-box-containing protein
MHALRLKTKLVMAITLMVMAIVTTMFSIYVSEVVRQRFRWVNDDATFIAQEIFTVARGPLESDLRDANIDLHNPIQVNQAIQDAMQTDLGVNKLLESVIGYSPLIYDAAIADTNGYALLHTNSSLLGKTLKRRQEFKSIVEGGRWQQLKIVYGPIQTYDVQLPLARGNAPFGEVRVGVSTTFLKSELRPLIRNALLSWVLAIIVCMVLAAVLSNLMLRPLAEISRRLDLISSGQAELPEASAAPADEYGVVSSKIDRLGRQMRDVKEVFSALKENLDQMMANLQDGVMLFTTDFKTVLVSASAERFTGKPRGEMLGCHPQEIFSDDSRLGHAVLQAFRDRQPMEETEIETENGRRVQISMDFIEDRGQRIGALLTLRDAESVHRIEDEIELSRRLSAIGRLTSGVAHEVKNPINAIVVHLEVLRQKLSAVDPDTRRHLDVIGSEIKRLDRVVQTLVDFTRPVELRLAEIDLRKLVDEVITLASPEAARHNVQIERAAASDPLATRIDADLVKQALLNIVINGVQAMPGGGTLHVASRREGEVAVVEVRDEGPGIPAEIRDKIYNLYFTTKQGGSGIGLAMTYRVLQLHHGSLEFESEEGKGAAFYLRFPLLENVPRGGHAGEPSEDSLRTA